MCCLGFLFFFIVPFSNKAAPNDLLFTPAPLPFPSFVEWASSVPQGTRESLRAPCDDQRVLEWSWRPIICLPVASRSASHFSRVPFLIFLPGELFHIWNGLVVFLFPDMPLIVTLMDLRSVYFGAAGRKKEKICRRALFFSPACMGRRKRKGGGGIINLLLKSASISYSGRISL